MGRQGFPEYLFTITSQGKRCNLRFLDISVL